MRLWNIYTNEKGKILTEKKMKHYVLKYLMIILMKRKTDLLKKKSNKKPNQISNLIINQINL